MMRVIRSLNRQRIDRFFKIRQFSLAVKNKEILKEKMQAWQIHSYGGMDELQLSQANIPLISNPNDILIKVNATSINPIDIAMISGYGSKVLNLMRQIKCNGSGYSDIEFPLTLGRDFAGTVVSKGHGIDRFKIGDNVWGVVPVEQQGCHSEYVLVNSDLVNLRPKNLSDIEAASILYAGLTAWSALWYSGGFCCKNGFTKQTQKPVLVLGGSGGVGTLAIQLLKAWNIQVVTTCKDDAVDMLTNLGADIVVNYSEYDSDYSVIKAGPYSTILDCCKMGPDIVKSKSYPHDNYITLNSPLLKNIDEHGFFFGSAKNVQELLKHNIPYNGNKAFVKWGFFSPSPYGMNVIQNLVEQKKILPVIQEVFTFTELPKAYQKVSEGHLRGKVVVDLR